MSPITHNEQFGQKIGVDDVSTPKAARGPKAMDSHMVDDPNQGERVRFTQPVKRPPPGDEASGTPEAMRERDNPGDLSTIPEAPSVWEAGKKPGDV